MSGSSIFYKINFCWRLLVTGLSFAFFGLGALVLSLFVFPFIALFTFDDKKLRSRIRGAIRGSFKAFFAVLHHGRLFDFRVEGIEAAKSDRGVIIVANHPCLIDVVALISVMPNVSCIVKKALFRNPFLKGVVKGAGYIPNDESEGILELCRESLKRGDNIIIFPEGTRTVPGQPMSLKRGAAQIAFRLGAPVRLVKITVNPSTLTKGEPWYSIPSSRALFLVEVKHLISSSAFADKGFKPSIAARRITDEIRQNIASAPPV